MLWKLFSVDGKIPFVQIVIGILLGVLGMYVYTNFYKKRGGIISISPEGAVTRKVNGSPQAAQVLASAAAPVLLDVNKQFRPGRNVPGMPRLPVISETQSDTDESEEEEDEDEDDEDDVEDDYEDEEVEVDNEHGMRVIPTALGTIDDTN